MAADKLPEHWLRGTVPNIIPVLQPVAHALLQAKEEIITIMGDFNPTLLWQMPGGVASPGFHLQHIAGVQDRLLTYARGEQLTPEQLKTLKEEGLDRSQSVAFLLQQLVAQTDTSIKTLESVTEKEVLKARGVGRAQLPSTVLGLMVHAAEHTMRHAGQLLVTVRVLQNGC